MIEKNMTPRDAKAYLSKYRESLELARKTSEHLAELKAEAEQLRDHEGQSVELDAAVIRYVDACNDAGAYLEMLGSLRVDIRQTVERVADAKLRELLREIYINGKPIVRVAADREQSYEHICRLHGAALLAVCKMIGKV